MERTKVSKAVAWAILSSSVALTGAAYSADSDKSAPSATERARPPAQQQGERFWASDLIGKNVTLPGDRKGEIRDIIVDSQGQIRHVVTKVSGDQGDRLYALPADKFQVGEGGKIMLNVDQQWLAQQKSWSEDKWPSLTDRGYWRDEKAASGAAAGEAHRLSRLIGQDVKNPQGKEVGEIDDAVVNLKSQKVEFVLFDYDPGVTKGEREYALSMSSFKFPAATADGGEAKQPIVLNMEEQKLQSLKPLDRADKKRINDPDFMSRIQVQ